MTKPRLSMKMLWELRGDFCLSETSGRTKAQDDVMEYTRRFLQFVNHSVSSRSPSSKSK